jgi:hypothetical protein
MIRRKKRGRREILIPPLPPTTNRCFKMSAKMRMAAMRSAASNERKEERGGSQGHA